MKNLRLSCWLLLATAGCASVGEPAWRELSNGRDLEGWDTWLGPAKRGEPPIGLNRDPRGVFSAVRVDGAPVFRISGEGYGAMMTTEEFENYHFRVEYKWGTKKWPPRENDVRDSGVMYHSVGPPGAAGGAWMKSLQCNVAEHDSGDFWSTGGARVDVEGVRLDTGPESVDFQAWKQRSGVTKGMTVRYRKGGEKFAIPGNGWILRSADHEKPDGEWNLVEVITAGQTSLHAINGKTVMVMTGARHVVDGKEVPLTRGKIQLQSEGAELYFRNPAIRPIPRIPADRLE